MTGAERTGIGHLPGMAEGKEPSELTGLLARPLDVAARNVRAATAVAPVKPAYAAGLRAALATVVPLFVAQALGLSGGTWMSLAGFSGAISDKGGAYATRAAAIASLTGFGALAVLLGAVVAHDVSIAVMLTFTVALICALGRAWGNTGATVGGSVLSMFVISLAYPSASLTDALGRSGYVILGGVWAALVALVLWPVRPYRPARLALAECLRTLAAYVSQVVGPLEAPHVRDDALPAGSLAVRAALENARATLAAIRRGRPGESGRGERLLVLRETADQMFGNLIALVETVEAIPPDFRQGQRLALIAAALRDVIRLLHELADRVEEERQTGVTTVRVSGAALRESLTIAVAAGEPADVIAHYTHAATLLDRIAQFANVAAASVAALDGAHVPAPVTAPETEEPSEPRAVLAPLRSVLAHDSLVLRHALRVAIVTAAAVLIAGVLRLPRGYWVTVTAVIILQPYTGATTLRAVQRVIGTVVGGILTAALGALFHDIRAILVLSFIFAAVSVAVLPLNYTAFSIFLTPTFVLLAEASAGDWHLATVRVTNTLLGGGLALLGARLLWPAPEWARLPIYLAAALRANRDYLRTVVRIFPDRSDAAGRELRARRRDAALAAINAEESFQRVLGEHGGRADVLAPVMTFLTYVRRFTVSVAALAVSRHAVDPSTATVLEQFADGATKRLDLAAARLTSPHAEPPGPAASWMPEALRSPSLDPILRARLTRLERQLDTLVASAGAIATPGNDRQAHGLPEVGVVREERLQ
jgi:uncharacterized membrane protein YccC